MAKHRADETELGPGPIPGPEPGKQKFPREGTKDTGPGQYRVSLTYLPSLTVQADSPEDAWEKFKAAHGIIGSDYEPQITKVD